MNTNWKSGQARLLFWMSAFMFMILMAFLVREFVLRKWSSTYLHYTPYMIFQNRDDKVEFQIIRWVVMYNMFGGIWILLARLYDWFYFERDEQVPICHCCGQDAAKVIKTSSDFRSHGTPICQRCFDERILSERWANVPGTKWFDKEKI